MSDVEAIRELAEREERERREAEREAERAAREQRRIERELDRPPPPVEWFRFASTKDMDSKTFSRWCDEGKPRLGLPPLPPAPPPPSKPPGLKLDRRFAERLGDTVGKLLAAERERLAGELALRDARITELEGRLRRIEQGLIERALTSEPIDLPPLRLSSRHGH